jgi:hypothetical protein
MDERVRELYLKTLQDFSCRLDLRAFLELRPHLCLQQTVGSELDRANAGGLAGAEREMQVVWGTRNAMSS